MSRLTPAEVITTAISDEGGRPGSSIHSWRCEYDRYGPCDCVAFVANEVVAALTAAGYSIVRVPSVDALSNEIRRIDGNHTMGAVGSLWSALNFVLGETS
jgi:hypothetical protein